MFQIPIKKFLFLRFLNNIKYIYESKKVKTISQSQTIFPFNVVVPKKVKITSNINNPKSELSYNTLSHSFNIRNKEEPYRNKNNFFHSIIVTKNINKKGGPLSDLVDYKNIQHKDKNNLEPKKNILLHEINVTQKEPKKDVVTQTIINKSIIPTRIYHLTETNNNTNKNYNQFSYSRKNKTYYKPPVSFEQKKADIKDLKNKYQIKKTQINLRNIKSPFIIKKIFSFLYEKTKLDIIKYNKYFQKLFSLNVKYYKKISGKYKIEGINGNGKEFILNTNILIFEGEYKDGKKNGVGKEYNDGNIIFEGEYKDGKKNGEGKEYHYCYGQLEYDYKPYFRSENSFCDRYVTIGFFEVELKKAFEGEYKDGKKNGKGKEYYSNGKIKFAGEYLNGEKWKGSGYDTNNNIVYKIEKGNGKVKEFYPNGKLKFEGEYLNGKINGKVKEYKIKYEVLEFWQCELVENREFYYLEFEGEYLNGKRNGKGKEYDYDGKLQFEGEYKDGERNGKGKEYYFDGKIKYEGEYLNGKRNGKGKEYGLDKYYNNKLQFEGEYKDGERNGKGKEYYSDGKLKFAGEYLNGKRNRKGKEYL